MKTKNIVIATLIGAGILFVVAGVIYHYLPTPKKCDPGGCLGITGPTPGCTYLPETAPDGSLPTPQSQPYLGGFKSVPNAGPPFCTGVWYAYRYVTPLGGYSPLSQWTGYNPDEPSLPPLPIYGGSQNLPCAPGGCEAWGIAPSSTCSANAPEIIISGTIPSLPSGTFLNVHRQSGQVFDPTSEGDIVGSFNLGPQQGTPIPVIGFFVDVLDNPDPKSQLTNCCSN